jgi:hypothetical protein
MQQWDTIELSWVSDLISPRAAGKYFSRHGLRVVVSSDDFEAAQSALAKGAKDVLFTAARVDTLSRDAYYTLTSFKIIR